MSSNRDVEVLTEEVLASFAATANPRARQILESLVTHVHAFITEVEPTIDEWEVGIDFLTRTGKACTDVRQEFILLSDVLGVTMLVETINGHEAPDATDSTVLGPFHMVDSPVRELGDQVSPNSSGQPAVVVGTVTGPNGERLGGAVLDIWQADTEGFYDVQRPETQGIGNGRALLLADEQGEFWFRSVVPSYYPIPTDGPVGELLDVASRHPYRPAHIHFLVSIPGYRELTTHIFVAEDPYIASDAVFAVKPSLVVEFVDVDDPDEAHKWKVSNPFRKADVRIVLDRESAQ
jgi:hydroxyquinol 1,2-dioxygenase